MNWIRAINDYDKVNVHIKPKRTAAAQLKSKLVHARANLVEKHKNKLRVTIEVMTELSNR